MNPTKNDRFPVNQLKKDAKQRFGVKIDRDRKDLFNFYYELLVEWNRKVNLYPKGAEKYLYTNYFLDSLAVLKYLPMPEGSRVLDFGSGNGCPGFPLKLVQWDLDLQIVESNRKKALFLQHFSQELKKVDIDGIEIYNQRLEELSLSEPVDFFVTRATYDLEKILEIEDLFLREKGYLIYYAGQDAEEQVNQNRKKIKEQGFQIKKIFDYKLPNMDFHRYLIILQNQKPKKERING